MKCPPSSLLSSSSSSSSAPPIKVGGRVTAVRDMGKILFLTIKNDGESLQVLYSASDQTGVTKERIKDIAKHVKAGDIVGVTGCPVVTKRGEPSISATEVQVLAKYAAIQETNCPSLTGYVKPSDPDILFRYRFIDLMCNSESQKVFRTRAKVLGSLRSFLDNRGFVEVETPVFHTVPSGAAARPFRTFHECNDADLFLRVAPELYLKQLVVGGMDKVYEIGRVFRNEDSDKSHNPEFTSCEFYQAFATYRELMPMTEDLIRFICKEALGKSEITVLLKKKKSVVSAGATEGGAVLTKEEENLISEALAEEKQSQQSQQAQQTQTSASTPVEGGTNTDNKNANTNPNMNNKPERVEERHSRHQNQSHSEHDFVPRVIDLSKPFRVVDIIPELESHLGLQLPRPVSQLDSEEGAQFLLNLLKMHDIRLPQPQSPAKLFDKLIDHFITDHAIDPTFVIGHPTFMSPLAKEDPSNPGVSERFELFINGMEICNSYSELNDPVEQKHRFEQQLKQRVFFNDAEAQCVDETFLKALQTGLPPTAGWGMGIDRLVMLLCGCANIREVILFPLLRDSADSRDSKRKREAASFFGFDPFMTKFILNSLEAEFMKRGGVQGVNLVRNVHRAVDSIIACAAGESNVSAKAKSDCFFEKAAAVAAAAVGSDVFGASVVGADSSKDIVERAGFSDKLCKKGDKPNAECGLMALLLLDGLRDGHYHVKTKSEQLLLDVALKALCDPTVASHWWWGRK